MTFSAIDVSASEETSMKALASLIAPVVAFTAPAFAGAPKTQAACEKAKLHWDASAKKCDVFMVKQASLIVDNWGPQSMKVGDIPNKQPNGQIGLWILAKGTE